ncbi:nitrile hydratase subunit beta [Pseudonocardia asaccharolytica]|uniref:Nitrile hydratase subunit beta n=1 Tax=Pseudonocardia asaccharolytica DSM 44247 = NBRC 16224 TaxID=1123024 RepID=A0A511CZB3_9PSEU|nr:nitrile hydratase subunit beta [Pseudonocardia asaccharolytica]GEL17892.1 nitrile hydratase [Pseudonocardia asaccharolytica DSM 44247 = NBRC 16224]
MNGVHDLGGTDGLGPVVIPEHEPVWRAEWEKTAFALFPTNFRAGLFGVDMFRFGIEQMHPAVYLLSPYYEHWLHSAEHYATRAGVIDPAELDAKTQYYLDHPDEPLPDRKDPDLLAFVDAAVKQGAPARRESSRQPKFQVGDRVTVVDDSPRGHTRKARYIRGKSGVVELAHGTFIYPDSAGNGGEDDPQHVYTVKFTGEELWGADAAEPGGVVYVDVWEPYIVPAREESAA